MQDMQLLQTKRAASCVHGLAIKISALAIGRVDEQRNHVSRGNQFTHQLEPFRRQLYM